MSEPMSDERLDVMRQYMASRNILSPAMAEELIDEIQRLKTEVGKAATWVAESADAIIEERQITGAYYDRSREEIADHDRIVAELTAEIATLKAGRLTLEGWLASWCNSGDAEFDEAAEDLLERLERAAPGFLESSGNSGRLKSETEVSGDE